MENLLKDETMEALLEGETASPNTNRIERPSFRKKEQEKEDKMPAEVACPYCNEPLSYIPGTGYIHPNPKNCNPIFESENDIRMARRQRKANTSQSAFTSEGENQDAAQRGKITTSNKIEEADEVITIEEDLSEEELKKRLGLLEEKENKPAASEEAAFLLEETPEKELFEKEKGIGNITGQKKEKLKEKITKFREGEEEKMEEFIEKKASEIDTNSRRAIIIRSGKTSNKKDEQKEKPREEIKKSLEEDEDLGKTQILTPPEEETKIYPTLTDLQTGEILTIEQPETLIGRSKLCQIIIKENVISHEHAYLILKNDKAYIRDDKSSNGTFIMENESEENIFRIPQGLEVEIKDGCIIQFANKKFRFSMEG